MVISASRRTDIPSCHPLWLSNRVKEGYVLVRNPYRHNQVTRVPLGPEKVDAFVFWTKNPLPLLPYLHLLDAYNYYFQFTVTSYGRELECNIPSKSEVIIPAFKRLSSLIGAQRVIWRYDPVLLSRKYTVGYHKKYFSLLAERLSGSTHRCIVSFIDMYPAVRQALELAGCMEPDDVQRHELLEHFVVEGRRTGIEIGLCCEDIDEDIPGIKDGCCIDKTLIERISGTALDVGRDRNHRSGCTCAESIDIGCYGTCSNGCLYCYANRGIRPSCISQSAFDPHSPLLGGHLKKDDVIIEREFQPCSSNDLLLF